MVDIEDKDVWGDDQLIASDVSIPYLLQRADWTGLFNGKGYDGVYPMLLFVHDEAELLNDQIMAEINRTQVLEGNRQLRVNVATKFIDNQGVVEGRALMQISGLDEFSTSYTTDLIYLLKSSVKSWLTEAYSTHGVTPIIEWDEDSRSPFEGEWEDWMSTWHDDPSISDHKLLWASITQ